jgi:chemotaxis protein MotB
MYQPPPYQQPPYGQGPYAGYDPQYQEAMAVVKPSKTPWVLLVLTLGAAGTGGYYALKERGRLQARVAEADEIGKAKVTLEERVKALEAEKAALATARDALAKSVEEKSQEIAELKGTQDKLQEKMKAEIASGDIQLTTAGGRLRVDMVDKILFESGDARISKRGENVLARLGAVLAGIDGKQIQVLGHTDNNRISNKLKAEFPTNWELSVARATNVVRFLHESAGVPPDRLVASGHGEFLPVASNRSAAGRARNRRIEILLTPALAPKAISKAKLKEQATDAKVEAKGTAKPEAAKTAAAK